MTRRTVLGAASTAMALQAQAGSAKYIRFQKGTRTAYGLLRGEDIQELNGDFLMGGKPNGTSHKLKEVKLLAPVAPGKVIAIARNYKSHLGTIPPPPRPEMFYKPTASICGPGDAIVLPQDSTDVHYEGELVAVIGKRLRKGTKAQAAAAVFGVTCGNDVSERQWQGGPDKDIQWWRAKGSDTFGPLGPWVVTGVDYSKLMLRTRLNGKVVQEQSTAELIYDIPTMIAFTSKYVTLEPGDVVYTGTPGTTKKMSPGDVVEVDIEGIGVLRNPVRAE
ncbi:MAG TPA: fumarylacetoacetate hydrolase family protein [Bryobacteraceae bacterium]|nr:fumarylacetoacetate hydrolase family protein [Bryobacteraceae bacterium]